MITQKKNRKRTTKNEKSRSLVLGFRLLDKNDAIITTKDKRGGSSGVNSSNTGDVSGIIQRDTTASAVGVSVVHGEQKKEKKRRKLNNNNEQDSNGCKINNSLHINFNLLL